MDNFSAAQYDRFEAYRRHALPKQAVRKVCLLIALLRPLFRRHNVARTGHSTGNGAASISARRPNSRRFLQGFRW